MLSLIARMGAAAAPAARGALGAIGSGAASLARGTARAVGRGLGAIGGYLVGSGNTPLSQAGQRDGANDNQRTYVDTSTNENRVTQLAVTGSQPSPIGGVGADNRRGDGFASSAVLALLQSIDSGIKSLREEMHQSSGANAYTRPSYPRASYRSVRGLGETASFGIGLLGLAAGSVLGSGQRNQTPETPNTTPTPPETPPEVSPEVSPQPRVNPAISEPANQPTQTLERDLGINPAPDLSALQQPPTIENRQPFQNDLNQLNNALVEIRQQANDYTTRSRNPRHNRTIGEQIRFAENTLNVIRQQYESGQTNIEAIDELRRQFLGSISAIRNMIGGTVTPQNQTREIPSDVTPAAPDDAPGPQSSIEDGLVNVVANRDIDLYSNDTISDPTKNSYINYMVAAMANTNKISISSESGSLTLKDIISGNEDNVSRKLNAIQVTNPVGGQGSVMPIVINGGGNDARPAVIPVPKQQNTPAPSPGTGAILIGYRSHPMLANEPRSPAAFSHP